MGTIAAPPPVTLEEFLANPAYEQCEWIDGRILVINVGNRPHARSQANCIVSFGIYFRVYPGRGYVASELRCRLKAADRTQYYLPDVSIVLDDRSAEDRFLEGSPQIVVEVRSPGDNLSTILRKMNDYFANGAKIGWVILPEERAVLILAPDAPLRTAVSGEHLDCGGLLPDLKIAVDELFL